MKFQAGFVVASLMVFACVWGILAPSKQADAQQMPPTRFEYKFERTTLEGIAYRLNEMSPEHWEYVEAIGVNGTPDQYVLIVKRPKM